MFGHLNIRYLDLFRISIFGFSIYFIGFVRVICVRASNLEMPLLHSLKKDLLQKPVS
jgi:hypothetical protein